MSLNRISPRKSRKPPGRASFDLKDAKAISRRLREWVRSSTLTQDQFAERSGISIATLKRWIRKGGVNGLDVASMLTLARAEGDNGISLDWLLLGAGPERRGITRSTKDLHEDVVANIAARAATRAGVSHKFASAVAAGYGGEKILEEAARRFAVEVATAANRSRASTRRRVEDLLASTQPASDRLEQLRGLVDMLKPTPEDEVRQKNEDEWARRLPRPDLTPLDILNAAERVERGRSL